MTMSQTLKGRSPWCCGYVLVYDSLVNRFDLPSLHFLHFRTNTLEYVVNPFIPQQQVKKGLFVFFEKDGFGSE